MRVLGFKKFEPIFLRVETDNSWFVISIKSDVPAPRSVFRQHEAFYNGQNIRANASTLIFQPDTKSANFYGRGMRVRIIPAFYLQGIVLKREKRQGRSVQFFVWQEDAIRDRHQVFYVLLGIIVKKSSRSLSSSSGLQQENPAKIVKSVTGCMVYWSVEKLFLDTG